MASEVVSKDVLQQLNVTTIPLAIIEQPAGHHDG
jgi:hypothetical protein